MKKFEEIIKPYKKQLQINGHEKFPSYDVVLIKKWKHRIPKGWYGFDGINSLWGKIIDDFLVELEKDCPDFEIHQIKSKFGSLRFYVSLGKQVNDYKLEKYINQQIRLLEDTLF